MTEEMQSKKNWKKNVGTWKMVPVKENEEIIDSKWVFRVKVLNEMEKVTSLRVNRTWQMIPVPYSLNVCISWNNIKSEKC